MIKATSDISTEPLPGDKPATRPAFQFFDQRDTFMPTVELWESTKKQLAALEAENRALRGEVVQLRAALATKTDIPRWCDDGED